MLENMQNQLPIWEPLEKEPRENHNYIFMDLQVIKHNQIHLEVHFALVQVV